MEPWDTVVAASENQDFYYEGSKKSFFGDSNHHMNQAYQNDDYSDIYYDKSCINIEDGSQCNFSNFPKEIQLDEDGISENEIFLKPFAPDYDFHKRISMSARRSECANMSEIDYEENHPVMINTNLNSKIRHNMVPPLAIPIVSTAEYTGTRNQNILTEGVTNPGESLIVGGDESQKSSKFAKNDGKLIFKITRLNRTTQKEKIITKSRRIISKCPHTNMKYYAKGMWK